MRLLPLAGPLSLLALRSLVHAASPFPTDLAGRARSAVREWESRLLAAPSPDNMREAMRRLAEERAPAPRRLALRQGKR